MIDLHSHLLPGIDDGAQTMAEALELAAHAVACGTTHMVCTPHLHPGRYNNTAASIALVVGEFAAALAQADIPLHVSAAAEARFDSDLVALAKRNELPFVGEWNGRQVLLLEFPHSEIPAQADKLTGWMLKNDIQPLIAHPERNKGVMANYKRIEPFLEQGCLLQVTAGSLAGQFGASAQELAEFLLLSNHITLLASDAHNMKNRQPNLLPGLEQATRLVGETAARKLVEDHPWRMAEGHFSAASSR